MTMSITKAIQTVLIGAVLSLGFVFLPMQATYAVCTPTTSGPGVYGTGTDCLQDPTGTTPVVDPHTLARNIINYLLGFLGIIAVIIILIAGFKWMTAGGTEEKVTEAQTMLIQGVIGLAIILAAWGIAGWVITTISGTILK